MNYEQDLTQMHPAMLPTERRHFYISGESVELWENSEVPFGWGLIDLESYAVNGDWDLLFNALVLASSAERSV